MARFQRPAEGTWTAHYPELGTGPVSFEDSISPAFYLLEREAIFKRAWLNVGRMEQLPRNGSYFTKDLPGVRTSIIVSRDLDGRVRAFHNVCRHRGNKLLWQSTPRGETAGNARQFVCKYHGWRYGLDGACTYVHQENEFFDLRKDEIGLAPVHCDTWAGFIFVNLDREPRQTLRGYLGPMIGALEGYPFHRMTEGYSFRAENDSNWKVFSDAFQEYYHVPPLHTHQLGPTPEAQNPEYEFEGAHYQLDGPHRMVTTSGTHKHNWPREHLYPSEALTRSGNTRPWDAPDLGGTLPPGVNKAPTEWVEEMGWYGRLRHRNMLEIDAIMIAAVNGPSNIHSELALMCDIVLASEDAYFQDMAHFPRNLSPGDGIQNIWSLVMGRNRWRYAQLMGQKITARMAHEWGAVNEVLPKAELMDRAREIARYLLRFSPIVLRHTRRTFVQEFKRAAVNDLGYGQSLELLGMTQFTPYGGAMNPLDCAWNDPELWKKR